MTRAPFCVKENDTVTQPLEELAGRASLVPSGEESACKCRGHGFDPWSGKIPYAMEPLSPCTTTPEPVPEPPGTATTKPMCPDYQSLRAPEPMLCNKRSHGKEKPVRCN